MLETMISRMKVNMSLGDAPDGSATVTVPPRSGCPVTVLPAPTFEVVPVHAATTAARASAVIVVVSEYLMRTIACSRSPRSRFSCCSADPPNDLQNPSFMAGSQEARGLAGR